MVTGGPFPVLDVAPSVWIDTTRIGDALENEDLSELQAIVFDPSLMRNGAVIGISMGACGEGRTDLPETMQLQATP